MPDYLIPLRRGLHFLNKVEDGLLVLLLLLMIVSAAGQIILRDIFHSGFVAADPFARLMVLWVAMLGAVVAARNDKHINIDILSRLLSQAGRRRLRAVIHVISAGVCIVITYSSLRFVIEEFRFGSTVFSGTPAWIAESIIPLGFGLISLHYLVLAVFEYRMSRQSLE
ncbi:MAG: TRAP transporter small permease [Acidiferrobacterales bacterium]